MHLQYILSLTPFFPFSFTPLFIHYSSTAAALQSVVSPPFILHIPLFTSVMTFPRSTLGGGPPPHPPYPMYTYYTRHFLISAPQPMHV